MFNTAPYTWVVSHLQVIGWPAVLYGVFRFVKVCFRVGRASISVEQRVLKGEETLHLMATNHLPHLQLELENINKNLEGLRDDFRALMVKD